MWILILLILFPVPEQNSKVEIRTGLPGAEIYLDGNLVYITDESGTVPMENFPAGSFNLTVKKQGYKPYNGSFTLGEGETRQINLTLEKIRLETPGPPAGKRSSGSPKDKSAAQAEQKPVAASASAARGMQVPETPLPGSHQESQDSSILPVAALLCAVVLLAIGFRFWRKKADPEPEPAPHDAPEAEIPEPQGNAPNRQEPQFIEELKRREELLKAGFVASQPRAVNPETAKEKEVVIVLPKEAFRYEEDK